MTHLKDGVPNWIENKCNSSKWIKNFHVRLKIMKLLKKKRKHRAKVLGHKIWQLFLRYDTKGTVNKRKKNRLHEN